jgi:hypothetical protein
MASTTSTAGQGIRIRPEDLKARMEAGEPVTVLDVRNPTAWGTSRHKVRGAVRENPGQLQVDPSWPKGQLTVVY